MFFLKNFLTNFAKDLIYWIYYIFFFQIFRLIYIFLLSKYMGENVFLSDILYTSLYGLRFDIVWATVFISFSFIFFTLPSFFIFFKNLNDFFEKFRFLLGLFFTFFSSFIYFSSVEYYKEYHDIFNQFVFSLIYDDFFAIIKTVISEYHVFQYLFFVFLILIFYLFFLKRILYSNSFSFFSCLIDKNPFYFKLFILFISFFLFVGGIRGGFGDRPIQLKDAGITCNSFLNKAIISPLSALRYAYKDYIRIMSEDYEKDIVYLFSIKKVAFEFFSKFNSEYFTDRKMLYEFMEKKSSGSLIKTPNHIFLIVCESYDIWPLKKEYEFFHLGDNLKNIIKNGIFFRKFLPASDGTMASLNTIITGLPDVGIFTNYQFNSKYIYLTSPIFHFKRLGYKTRLFYGGYLTWQRLNDFAKSQCFDYVYGASHISNWLSTNEWGVDDVSLFNFVLNNIDDSPSFNIVLTVSNHPPFSLDLRREGFKPTFMYNIIKSKFSDSPINVKHLGHFWYADRGLGNFVRDAEIKFKDSLFAITGDHYSRRHLLINPSFFDSSVVPFVLYSKSLINKDMFFYIKDVGGHLDICPTIIELIAPKDFIYYSMGRNLLNFGNNFFGIGKKKIISKNWIGVFLDKKFMFENMKGERITIKENEENFIEDYYNKMISLSRWCIMKRDSFF